MAYKFSWQLYAANDSNDRAFLTNMAKSYRNTLIRIKANVYITEVFNYSHGTSLVHQRGRRSIVLEHSVFSMMYAIWNNLIGRTY